MYKYIVIDINGAQTTIIADDFIRKNDNVLIFRNDNGDGYDNIAMFECKNIVGFYRMPGQQSEGKLNG